MLDCVIEEYHITSTRLSSLASILYQPDFEKGITKVQGSDIANMTDAELEATDCFKIVPEINSTDTDSNNLSFTQRVMIRRKTYVSTRNQFMDHRFLLPTSNICE